jgi:hypothetical protein
VYPESETVGANHRRHRFWGAGVKRTLQFILNLAPDHITRVEAHEPSSFDSAMAFTSAYASASLFESVTTPLRSQSLSRKRVVMA